MKSRLTCGAAVLAATSLLPSCLPADDRPPPGSVTFTVSPSDAVRRGVTTADGWQISFSRLLVDLGRTSLSDGCTEYAEARYDRLLDVTKGSGQRLSIIYGLGQCDVRFRIAPPTPDVLLGTGVSNADKLFMGTYGTDPYAKNTTSVWVEGRATRGGEEEAFRWAFRKSFRYGQCRLPGDAGSAPPISLVQNVGIVKDIVIEGEALFRDVPLASAELHFAPFADADRTYGNGDGVIDLDELARVPLSLAASSVGKDGGDGGSDAAADTSSSAVPRDGGAEEGSDAPVDASTPYAVLEGGSFKTADGSAVTVETLRDYVYVLLLPTLPRLEGDAPCALQRQQMFR